MPELRWRAGAKAASSRGEVAEISRLDGAHHQGVLSFVRLKPHPQKAARNSRSEFVSG
jgi:hypothetical protein